MVRDRQGLQDGEIIPLPNYVISRRWPIAYSAALFILGIIALFADKVDVWLRIVLILAAITSGLAAANGQFVIAWVIAIWRRAQAYPGVQTEIGRLRVELAESRAQAALIAEAPPLEAAGIALRRGRLILVLNAGTSHGLTMEDGLFLIDTVSQRLVGRATMRQVEENRSEANLHDVDAVFHGFLRDQAQVYRGKLPTGIIVISERSIRERRRGRSD